MFRKIKKLRWLILLIVALSIIAIMYNPMKRKEEHIKLTGKLTIWEIEPSVITEGIDIDIDRVKIILNVTVKNVGNASIGEEIEEEPVLVVVRVKDKTIKEEFWVHLKPNEIDTLFPPIELSIDRKPFEYIYNLSVTPLNYTTGEIIDTANASAVVPTASVGDTVVYDEGYTWPQGYFNLTINSWWIETNKNDESEADLIVNVTVYNCYSNRPQKAPSLVATFMTDRGYVWEYMYSDFYDPEEPWALLPKLMPGEKFTGLLRIYGFPREWRPVELRIIGVKEIIILNSELHRSLVRFAQRALIPT